MRIRLILMICGSFVAHFALAQSPQRAELFKSVYTTAMENHFQPDRFSPEEYSQYFFGYFLELLDPEHLFLSKTDVKDLSSHLDGLHTGLGKGEDAFLEAAVAKFEAGLVAAAAYLEGHPAEVWDLTVEEWMPRSLRDTGRALDVNDLENRWRLLAKRTYLGELKWEGQRVPTPSIFDQQDTALRRVRHLYITKIKRLKERNMGDYESMYLDAFLMSLDPQSGYFSSDEYHEWRDNAALANFAGLGVYTQEKMSRLYVTWVVPGGPAWKAGVREGDYLVAVSEASGPLKDLHQVDGSLKGNAGLKGPIGSEIQALIRHSDGREEMVHMTREEVESEKIEAFILSGEDGDRSVGYLKLPRFYYGARSSSDDFLECLEAFQRDSLDRMVLDLRGNRGGSAVEASRIIGMFIAQGPTMLSAYDYTENQAQENIDFDSEIYFRGKLLIIVDKRSASGSELVAGTLQAYQKSLIVGEPTYGKGSMQRFYHLPPEQNWGSVRITMGQFFSPSGASPQGTGILPDISIVYPCSDYRGEERYPNRFVGRSVESSGWTARDVGVSSPLTAGLIDSLALASEARTTADPFFQRIEKRNVDFKSDLSEVPLEYEAFQEFADRLDTAHFSRFSFLGSPIPGFEIQPILEVCDNSELYVSAKIERALQDPTLYEGFRIMQDMD